LAAVEAVEHGLQHGFEAGLEHEAAQFSEFATSQVSRNLVHLFFAETALKKDLGRAAGALVPPPIRDVAIVGAGGTGAAIAGLAVARAAVDVRLRDRVLERVVTGLRDARGVLLEQSERAGLSPNERHRLDHLLSGGTDWAGFRRAGLVIEAVPDDLGAKRRVVEEVESQVGSDCIIATTASTVSVSQIAAVAAHAGRVVGMHFLSPVVKTPLVEIVGHCGAEPRAIAAAMVFARRLQKTVIAVADSAGLWVNRILAPYLLEALLLLSEDVEADAVDSAMTEFGFRVGPVTLLDELGLDRVHHMALVLSETFGERMKPPDVLAHLVAGGRLGRKTGRGLYVYGRGKRRHFDSSIREVVGPSVGQPTPAGDITRRLVYSILNEAARALDEEVVGSARDGDLGAIYGIGFPPFTGGPLRHMDQVGVGCVLDVLEDLKAAYGERFAPAQSICQLAERGETFYQQPTMNGTVE
jgi:3-hydroxyacyl-CoA dehydrogenase/enoyl-CoA hydratase/3-hydroxybutyryl-CoA epimerase